ncbi:MAG: hypothetical protein LUO85_00975 [Methanomassiliicoccales archaeon]|nr:hypothetical protein [Methanomassiliicoccales archaeon]
MPLIKSAGDLVALGHDLVQRGNFVEANDRYSDAARKFAKQGDMMGANIASSYAAVVAIGQQMSNPMAYRIASQSLMNIGGFMMKIGLREVPANQLATELDLTATELEVLSLSPMNPQQFKDKAQALQTTAMQFRAKLTGQVLVIPELFSKTAMTGDMKAPQLMALAEEALGESLILEDPKAAAEHYQSARLWWMQAGRQDFADAASMRVRAYGRAAKCWFCGREVSGEGIHFVVMAAELTDVVKRTGEGSALPTFDPINNTIYACRGCYSAVFKLADDLAMKRTAELEVRIEKELAEIRTQIRNLRGMH